MILYSIRNWNSIYENNRSRTVTDLRWVPIPNRHDGEHYSRLMLRKDASEIFSAWILMLQVASRCHPRGTLMRSDGKPHDEDSLSLKTRAPVSWFQKALPVLAQMSWIEHVAFDCQEAVTQVTVACQSPVEEGKGMERIEKKEEPPPSFLKFWESYPKKVAKPEALKAWKKISPSEELLSKILVAIEHQKQTDGWMKDKGKFIPNPATWLNQERWEDETIVHVKPKHDYKNNPTLELHERSQP